MQDNPLEDTEERQQRIRERAYHLWEADGCPQGRELEFWERARILVGIEQSAGAEQLQPAQLAAAPEPVEEAAIQENYGEFPDRFTDQGERPQTPMTRRQMRKSTRQA